jgi:hypothetical protein
VVVLPKLLASGLEALPEHAVLLGVAALSPGQAIAQVAIDRRLTLIAGER